MYGRPQKLGSPGAHPLACEAWLTHCKHIPSIWVYMRNWSLRVKWYENM